MDIMEIIIDYCEKHDFRWEKLSGFCKDGVPAMLGPRSGLATWVKEKKNCRKSNNTLYDLPLTTSIKNVAEETVNNTG
jgi:hypothetical protein